ncbi:hypothetical protein [Qipengyuania sp. JC766]|uniref:hypothetical protein n=1 Tax=Qipengyuania sp. JC766 TaxID=3232139 RepID=UPI00345B0CB6
MKVTSVLAATAAVSLAATPVVAQSVQADRASAPVSDESELGGGSGIIIGLVAAAAVIAGIIIAADNEDDDAPASP